jgi:hypothetical protein
MKKYLYLFRSGDARSMGLTPEETQAHMAKWQTWMGGLAAKEILVDGLPLASEGKRLVGKSAVLTDGPYAEGKEVVGGYLIVKAGSLDEATDLAKGCPIFENDGSVEIRETMDM